MELWWIGADGSVQDRYYYDGSGWNGFTLAAAGSALVQLGSGPAITAVSRASNTMEVWFIGARQFRPGPVLLRRLRVERVHPVTGQ